MRIYELMVIYSPDLKESKVKEEVASLEQKIIEVRGKVSSKDYWGLKDFSYEMDKKTNGYYVVINVEIESTKVDVLSLWLKRQEDSVLRHIITKIDKKS